jgi:hypothetical protein
MPGPGAKLDQEQVRRIRREYATVDGTTVRSLAGKYGVTDMTISRVIRNRTYPDPGYTPPDTSGRQPRGERQHSAKLSWDDVRWIRRRYALGNVLMKDLAARYGVSKIVITKIIANTGWVDESYTPPQRTR